MKKTIALIICFTLLSINSVFSADFSKRNSDYILGGTLSTIIWGGAGAILTITSPAAGAVVGTVAGGIVIMLSLGALTASNIDNKAELEVLFEQSEIKGETVDSLKSLIGDLKLQAQEKYSLELSDEFLLQALEQSIK